MKKIIFILLALIVAVIIVTALYFYISKEESTTQVPNNVTFPSSNSAYPTPNSSYANQAGSDSFLERSDAIQDSANPGYYYLGYHPSGEDATENPPYLIIYTSETDYFNITLLQEPIGEVRRDAERYLLSALRMSEQELCSLNYTISVPTAVSGSYSSVNLGFSFCPGAVVLPQ